MVSAFNDQFERLIEQHIMTPRYGWPTVPIERHRCSQAAALSLALPASLNGVARALSLEQQKDDTGRSAMLRMAKPRRPRQDEDPAGTYWFDDPERREQLYAYCKQDVATERALHQRIGSLSQAEQDLWVLDAAINARGIHLDAQLLEAAMCVGEAAQREINAELQTLTAGAVNTINQAEVLREWLEANGCSVPDVRKATLLLALTRKDLATDVRRAMELRIEGAHAAATKLETMRNWRNHDGRVRGTFRFHGASTGRWTSFGIQLQNMKRPETGDMAGAIEAVATGDIKVLRQRYPQPVSVVGDITRALVSAAPGHRFIAADLSGIESRVTAWLSGQRSKLEQWSTFDHTQAPEDEPYYRIGKTLGLPSEQARSVGKTADLAFGYMGGKGAWKKLAGEHDTSTDEEIKARQQGWRNAHPETVRFWHALNRAAVTAIENPGRTVLCKRVSFEYAGDFLFMHLPSGRRIAYPFPRLINNDRGDAVVVFMDNQMGKWAECRHGTGAYGGTWIENAVQAVARDLFAAAMPRLEAAGYPIVLHVHDEIVAEVPDGIGTVDEFVEILTTPPDWAEGLPLAAKGRNGPRFAKLSKSPNPTSFPPTPPKVSPMLSNDEVRNYSRGARGWDRTEAEYIYRDEHDQPYHRVIRKEPKGFPQSHWVDGKWINGAPKGPRIPYRLPELIAAPPTEPVFICEGEKDANNVAELGLIATTNPGGAGKWRDEFAKWFTGKSVVYVLADNDGVGRAHAADVAGTLRGSVADIRVVSFPELPEHGDVSDWIAKGGTKAELIKRAQEAPKAEDRPRFLLEAFDEIRVDTEPAELVKDILPRVGLATVWGPYKCGKSFWMFDVAMHVALGWQYRGHKVQQGPVVYVTLEGGRGFKRRIKAFRQRFLAKHHTPVPFYLIRASLDLFKDHEKLISAIKARLGRLQPVMVVIDTLNRSLGGSESSDADMGNYVKAADAVRDAFECLVPIVHHCGIDATRPRGHTSLAGAVDAQISVKRDELGNILVKVELMKDGEEGTELASRLEVVEVGINDEGDPITSCVIVPVDMPEASAPKRKLSSKQETLYTLLHEAGQAGLTTTQWNERARAAGLGKKRPADLVELRNALKDSGRVYQPRGDHWSAR
jgi:DNA polymerase